MMKSVLCAALLLSAAENPVHAAQNPSKGQEMKEFCEAVDATSVFITMGDCMALLQDEGGSNFALACLNTLERRYYGLNVNRDPRNPGDCVQEFLDRYGDQQ